ncbi:hypothetical protein [Bernardetia sp.]|uniref:hypothetical protein n=1 Tax=Bernardetia sp. TaxID=1937974 RepID=UPI0025C5930F|nr:hypothetical protein [Bernardetia sp.]
MHPLIQKAIYHLKSNNYRGYFEEMELIVPVSMSTKYQELKGFFVAGIKNEEYKKALEEFALEIDKNLYKG